MSGVFCTNNVQAPFLFSNVTPTSRRTKLIVFRMLIVFNIRSTSCVCLLVLRWKRGRELVHCLFTNLLSARKTLLYQEEIIKQTSIVFHGSTKIEQQLIKMSNLSPKMSCTISSVQGKQRPTWRFINSESFFFF